MYFVKLIIRTILTFLIFALIYFVIFILPELLVKKELLRMEKSIYLRYYQLSLNRSFQTQYLSLKSDSMAFSSEKSNILSKIESSISDASAEVKKEYKSGFLFFPKREIKLNLDYIKKQDQELSLQSQDLLMKESGSIGNIKKLSSALANFYLYDMSVDFYGLKSTSDSDREVMYGRLNKADEGLIKVADKLGELEEPGVFGEDLKTIRSHIRKLAENFSLMAGYIRVGNYPSYESLFRTTSDDYEKARRESFQFEQSIFSSNDYLQLLADEKNIILKYEVLLGKINEMQ